MVEQHDRIIEELFGRDFQRIFTGFAIVFSILLNVAQIVRVLVIDMIVKRDWIFADQHLHASDGDLKSALTRHDLFQHGSEPKRREDLKDILVEDRVGENRKGDFRRQFDQPVRDQVGTSHCQQNHVLQIEGRNQPAHHHRFRGCCGARPDDMLINQGLRQWRGFSKPRASNEDDL